MFTNDYVLNDKDKERVNRDVERIAKGEVGGIDYRNCAINTLNRKGKCYMHYFANREQLIACTALTTCGYCNNYSNCAGCPLEGAWINARKEIQTGKRKKTYTKIHRGCETHVSISKNGAIHIIQIL